MVSRKRIYEVLANENENDKAAAIYNFIMVVLIALWMVPLWFKGKNDAFIVLDRCCTAVFIVDYLLRWATADFKLKRGKASFALYPFTPMAILDLISFVPSFIPANASLKTVRIFRVVGALRAFKLMRHSKSMHILMDAARNQRMPLLVTLVLAIAYVFASATVMFNIEPQTYDTFLDALYWSVISLTTIGYGDITPTTTIGRIVAMISAFAGVAIIAFPSGIIAAGLITELDRKNWDELTMHARRSSRADQADKADLANQTGQAGQTDQIGQTDQEGRIEETGGIDRLDSASDD